MADDRRMSPPPSAVFHLRPSIGHPSSIRDPPPMRWSNVWTIFRREVRDQVRDRRTLFMIFVVPILLYPMLGIGVAQLRFMFEDKPRTVVVVGAELLPGEPPLLDRGRTGFDPSLFDSPGEAARLGVRAE